MKNSPTTYDLQSEPLGTPLPPDSDHAVSVSMPNWQDVVDYEEGAERITKILKQGYPRFVYHQKVKQLFEYANNKFGNNSTFTIALPSLNTIKCCQKFLDTKGVVNKLHDKIWVLTLPLQYQAKAKAFWQHSGWIVSSRLAEDYLDNKIKKAQPKYNQAVINKIASTSTYNSEDIYLYPSGMGAIFKAYLLCQKLAPGKTIQLGFPYVDSLKIQQLFGTECDLVLYNEQAFDKLEQLLKTNQYSAIFTEIPSNPELKTVDLSKLKKLSNKYKVPIIIDDTVSTWYNCDVSDYADIIASSLTKFFSGIGDVMAGALILNTKSSFYQSFNAKLKSSYEDLTYTPDIKILADNCKNFEQRMHLINNNAEQVADFLANLDDIDKVYYPKYINNAEYNNIKTARGGYGGLLSFTLKDSNQAPAFYNNFNIHKGPSLGTNYSLCCPYVLLAHYHELDFVKKSQIEPNLIRISVGLDNPQKLQERILQSIKSL